MQVRARQGILRSIAAFASCSVLTASWAIAAPDFNGDGQADVLWRQANGQPLLWLMNGLSQPVRQTVGTTIANNWLMLGAGNFDGTNNNEILFLSSSGVYGIWFLQNGQFDYSCVSANGPAIGSTYLGIGDLDGDGKQDMFLLGADQEVRVKLLNGCSDRPTVDIGIAPPAASAVSVGDFDGDGHADILWHDDSGQYSVWLLDGNGLLATAALTPSIPGGWQLEKTADFNSDGKSDLLWRRPDGALVLSIMNGASHIDSTLASANLDVIFASGFDTTDAIVPPAPLPANWRVVDVGDYDGDGHADILLADDNGATEVWLMAGASVLSATRFEASADMPYPGVTGWVLPIERPSVTQVDGQVTVAWPPLPAISSYTVYASADNDPATSGTPVATSSNELSYQASDPAFSGKRYFSVAARIWGLPTPPSPESYLLQFSAIELPYIGPLAVGDVNGDGCIEVLGSLGDCHGGFTLFPEASMGLAALRANGRVWSDLRLADINGDGIDDVIASVHTDDSDAHSRVMLFWGIGNGQFVEDTAFTALGLGGYVETIVVADFDGDGRLDIFLPKYTFLAASEHNYLLMNNGDGTFTDMADAAGVGMHNVSLNYRPEGAQAVDLDGDGRIDLYTGSHLFLNRTTQTGHPVFSDESVNRAVPLQFDEGAKFVDWNNDGNLDLVLNDPGTGPKLWENSGTSFHFVDVMPSDVAYNQSYGMNAADLDGDGRPDLVVAGGCSAGAGVGCLDQGQPHQKAHLLLNRGSAFVRSDFFDDGLASDTQRPIDDLQSFADFDGNGALDVVSRLADNDPETGTSTGNMRILMNRASAKPIRVTVLGPAGERNQFGRVVRVSALGKPGFIMTDVVDGGSGYLTNGPYSLQFSTPIEGAYNVDVRLADRQVDVLAKAGQSVVIYADGTVTGAAGPALVNFLPPLK